MPTASPLTRMNAILFQKGTISSERICMNKLSGSPEENQGALVGQHLLSMHPR